MKLLKKIQKSSKKSKKKMTQRRKKKIKILYLYKIGVYYE